MSYKHKNCCNKRDDEGKKDYNNRGCRRNSHKMGRNNVDSKNYNHNIYSLHNEQDDLNTRTNWCKNYYNN